MSQHHRFFRPGLVVAGLLAASAAPAQTLLLGPYSISGDLCAGDDCGLLEDLTGQTVKLKDENTRLRFADSSTTAGFSTTDWELTANDSGSGGFDYFAIRNVDSNRQIFRLEGGAPANALYVDDLGQIGLGTAIPQERLHIVGDSGPGIRMEQFNATLGNQIWQITGSEQSFALQNVTASGAVPLQVSTSAPGDSLFVGASGNVGLGDATPDAALHISRGDGTAALLVENVAGSPGGTREMVKLTNTGGSYITFDNQQAGTIWYFTHEQAAPNRFLIADGVADGPEMTVNAAGDLTIQGRLFTAGSCSAGCDRVFDADYPLPTIAEQAAMMKANKHLPNVGPTPEDGPFNITAMTGGMLNELEKAHLYIAELEERLAAVEAHLARRD